MIVFVANIINPYSKRFQNLKCISGSAGIKHKYWELEFLKTNSVIGAKVEYSTRCDHAGLEVEISLAGFSAAFRVYDCRHWNYQTNNWEQYNETGT